MKSVRLDPETEEKLEMAAQLRGITESEFIRQAIRREARETLGDTLADRLADVLGIVKGGGGRARESHKLFQELIKKERKRRRS